MAANAVAAVAESGTGCQWDQSRDDCVDPLGRVLHLPLQPQLQH
mgnify:CR=1 FL=1